MNVLSLFDGISCARVALERAGIRVDRYFASEIDKYAIQIAKKNYSDIEHIGSVVDIRGEDYKDVDLLIGGSPCQDLSIAGKRKDIKGAKTVQRIEVGGTDKARTITTVQKDSMVMQDFQVRKLTPIECERLQGLEDNFTEGVSNTQRYKMLGNAFNVDVILHILKSLLD